MVSLAALAFYLLADPDSDRAQLTQNVGEIVAEGGVPGDMTASGSPAFVVLTAKEGGAKVPLFVAAHVGKGRALAGGHSCFFGESQLQNPNNERFFENGLVWLGRKPISGLRVGTLGERLPNALANRLGFSLAELHRARLATELSRVDVLWLGQAALDGDLADQRVVLDWVRAGGGLQISGCGWGWAQTHPGKNLFVDQTGNRLLGDFGVHFGAESVSGPYSPDGADNSVLTTLGALGVLQQANSKLEALKEASMTVDRALQSSASGDDSLKATIEAGAANESRGQLMPSGKVKISWKTPFLRLEARLKQKAWDSAAPEAIMKDPAADDFPGPVDPQAKRVSKSVDIDCSVAHWHATGLYAAPGEVVTVTVSESVAGQHLGLQIGPQTDELWGADEWGRFPQISKRVELRQAETKVATPFGGLIYINVPHGSTLKQATVRISHAVEAPLYILGETSLSDWRESQSAPAPWADLVGKHVSISLPREAIKNLKDPEALMKYWDQVFHYACELYQVPEGNRQERYCPDRQISAGYMHSGYPIMTWMDVANRFADLDELLQPGSQCWGFYHEMGHNFQQGEWTFEGTGEVTNNLFSVYGNEKLNGLTPPTYARVHGGLDPVKMKENIAAYVAKGAHFDQWKEDPFLALSMYMQLRIAFGWEPFQHVFALYQTLSEAERPHNDDEKRDQWMVRFSREVHKNLGPFFQAWGVPTSQAARDSIKDLPAWMPADWPNR